MNYFLGIDVGSVSTNLVVIDEDSRLLSKVYLRTRGQPIKAVQEGMKQLLKNVGDRIEISGVGTTGSGRHLAGIMVGADTVKNEITAHAVAALHFDPEVRTVIEIGGQDSKIIILRDGVITDFAMNTVCAAGTGSFLDQQANRLNIPIEEFGRYALQSKNPVRIAGRCAVFAESDMIHKQQVGYNLEDIIRGLCQALVRNYINNLAKGKDISPKIIFQGGVAANIGMKAAFEEAFNQEVIVPQYHDVMGAIGAALLAKDEMKKKNSTDFRGFDVSEIDFKVSSFECGGCPNRCEVVNFHMEEKIIARWGDRCGKWKNI